MLEAKLDRKGISKIFSRVLISKNGCWIWQGRKTRGGYGLAYYDGRNVLIHRLIYAWAVASIPTGYKMGIDHLCRNRSCCNPCHLELVTWRENVRRGTQWGETMNPNSLRDIGRDNATKTHCPKGHPYSGENLYVYKSERYGTHRACGACKFKTDEFLSLSPRFLKLGMK